MNSGSRLLPHLLLLLGLSVSLAAPLTAAEADAETNATAGPQLADPQLDQLLGPIALYPDALVALILPAATAPTEIVLAARYLNTNGDPAQIDAQPWSDSVKALARYPEVVKWMDENIAWTKQIGDAFLAQPADLMNSVQRLRVRARATGALVSTPQQQVVVDGDTIEIVPGQPDVIYVPRYDPDVVYVVQQPGYYYPYGSYLTFGVGFPVGLWLNYDFDWRHRTIWVGDRHHDWREHRDWRRQQPPGRPNYPNYPSNPNWHAWRPPVNRPPQPPRDIHRPRPGITQPRPFPGTPGFSNSNPPGRNDVPNRPRPDANAPRPPRPDNNNNSNNRPPRPDMNTGNPRPPRTDAPRNDRPNNPGVNVAPRTPPPERRTVQPPSVPANQPTTSAVYQPRPTAPANNVLLAPPSGSRPPPAMNRPPAMPRSPNPAPPPPPAPVARDPDATQKQN